MNIVVILSVAVAVLLVSVVAFLVYRRVPKRLKSNTFVPKWREVQQFCKDKSTWPTALTEADQLLDSALKRRKLKGKTMGERLVSAQRKLSNNDAVWFAHNLSKKVALEPTMKLKEAEVKNALVGFRQALKDLGAFEVPKEADEKQEVQAK